MKQLDPIYDIPAHRADSSVDVMKAAEELKPRRRTQADKILDRLRQGPATNLELSRIAMRFSARIYDLNHLGHDIRGEKQQGGVWLFSLYAKAVQQELGL